LTLLGSSVRITSFVMSLNWAGFFKSSGLISGGLAGISAKAAISL
jgi:hypothetical protein